MFAPPIIWNYCFHYLSFSSVFLSTVHASLIFQSLGPPSYICIALVKWWSVIPLFLQAYTCCRGVQTNRAVPLLPLNTNPLLNFQSDIKSATFPAYRCVQISKDNRHYVDLCYTDLCYADLCYEYIYYADIIMSCRFFGFKLNKVIANYSYISFLATAIFHV